MKKHHNAKTNACRLLDQAGIPYELREYRVDEEDLSAGHVAAELGLPGMQVFKTLVARGDRTGVVMACVPGAAELDLKALAHASGNKRIDLVRLDEITSLTGYVRGGVSPVGTRKPYPLFLDSAAQNWPFICVSAGVRGAQILISADNLMKAVPATLCEISRSPDRQE